MIPLPNRYLSSGSIGENFEHVHSLRDRRMRKAIITIAMSGLLLTQSKGVSAEQAAGGERSSDLFRMPSMVELLARSTEFEGAVVQTTGFYGGDITALFLTRDHAEVNDLASSFNVGDPTNGTMREHCAGHYVRIKGRFKRLPGAVYAGPDAKNFVIDDVTDLSILGGNGKETVCWSSEKRK